MDIIKKIKETILRFQLLEKGDTVIIGVSGGPDSTALLFLLNNLRHELGIRLVVAHFNHGLRKNAAVDQRFVENLAARLRIPFITASGNLRRLKKKGSVEEAARKSRFKFLIQAAQKYKADKIALGHTQDDLAETVLMRILRGTGLSGMRGILPKRTINGVAFVRPLVAIEKKEVLSFLKDNRIRFRIDLTNKTEKFFRNKIRLSLIPLLEKEYSKNIKGILANLSQTISTDYDYLEDQSSQLFKKLAQRHGGSRAIRFDMSGLQKLHPCLQRLLIRQAIEMIKGDTRRITFEHMEEIEDLIVHRPAWSIVDLPGHLSVLKEKSRLALKQKLR